MEDEKATFTPLIIDAHEDLAWNMMNFNRDYTLSAAEIRQREKDSQVPNLNGDTLLGWPEYQRGRVAIVFGVLFGLPIRFKTGAWETQSYETAEQAHGIYHKQFDRFQKLVDESPDKFHLIETKSDLDEVVNDWENGQKTAHPVGLVTLMEGAEGIRQPEEAEEWWELGVRIVGPAWSGTRFCGGTHDPGPLTKEGYQLLEAMADIGFTLDITHMDSLAALQALDIYPKGIIASHSNASGRLKGSDSNRHLPDPVIHGLIERDGIIGAVLFNGFLEPRWKKGDNRQSITLQHVIAQIDYVCQMAGDARHVGIGSDFDGGFGLQAVPNEIDTIADLQKLAPMLLEKGYSAEDVVDILGGNWLRHLRQLLPEAL